ncbi:hypothetical protein BGX34_001077 [Mortierella sp. NVP85]|nr:hypothetical protein BGX34_001077 [Mortierella sp. NVP85]
MSSWKRVRFLYRRLTALAVRKTAKAIKPTRSVCGFHSSRTFAALNPSLDTDQDTGSIFRYSEQHSTSLPDKFAHLHASSIAAYPTSADKTVSALQGRLLQLLMRMTRPRLVLELGCFMGYSAMAMADGMPEGTTLYTCEKDAKAAHLARDLFVRHGYHTSSAEGQPVSIELLEGEAMKSLQDLASKGLQFDAVFLDADKGNYINYFNFILDNDLLTPHGYILADNVLFRGMVLQSQAERDSLPSPPASPQLAPQSDGSGSGLKQKRAKTSSQRTADHVDAFNKHVKDDPRVEVVVLPIFDGLSIIMKRQGKR